MPHKFNRSTVALPPALESALDALAEAVGKPRSTVIVDLLSELQPHMGDLAQVARYVRSANQAAARAAMDALLARGTEPLIEPQRRLFGPRSIAPRIVKAKS